MYSCRVKGHPMPKVTWEKDGQTLFESNHIKISVQGDEHILEILKTTISDAGNYTCHLYNPSGQTSHTAKLIVNSKSDFRSYLKTRPEPGNLSKRNSTDSEKSDKENEQQDFRNVLRRTEPAVQPDVQDKRQQKGVQQVDFRSVLKAKTGVKESKLVTKPKLNFESEKSGLHDISKKSADSDHTSGLQSIKSASDSKLGFKSQTIQSDNLFSKMDDRKPPKFETNSTPSSVKNKRVKEESSLLSKLNKFETARPVKLDANHNTLPRAHIKTKPELNSFQKMRNNFEQDLAPSASKSEFKTQCDLGSKGTGQRSVLGTLNKFEKLSDGDKCLPKKMVETTKPKANVFEKYANIEKNSRNDRVLNNKSTKKYDGLVRAKSEQSLKSRLEKFEKLNDSIPDCEKPFKLEKVTKRELPNSTWLTKPDREVPKICRELQDQRVRYGHQAVLRCKVKGGTVDWSVNGKAIKSSRFFQMSLTDENVATLTIVEAYSEDEGEYVCTATNKFGSVSSSCKLVVEATSSLSSRSEIEGPVTKPARLLTVVPSTVAVVTDQSVTIEAKFTGEPKPEVRWFKGRDELQKGGRINIENLPDSSVLTINKVTAEDAGKYIVAIENHASSDSLVASVSVEDVPEPPGKPQANDIMRSSIMLWWCGSPYDGGSQITHYKVQMKKVGDSNWTTVISNCRNTFHHVDNLEEKTPYYFRVLSANKHGFSCSGETSDKIFTSNRKISVDYESDDELPFEPRTVKVEKSRKFEDHYEVIHEVGKGKFGNVYKCKDKEKGKVWAAKVLKCREKEKANIRHEIDIMNDLAHPKLMMIWDAFEGSRNMTLVMEFVGGGELFERVISDDFELTEGDVVHFMRQICDGVGYMHDKGILHLDLKPENVLCISNNTNQIKIIDFGLARRYEDGKSMKVLFGTPEFIAPEVINYDEINFATDMWSIGVICYLLLSGLSPFLGDTDAETLANVTLGDYDFDDESFDDITENAKDFITCLLKKNKIKRLLIKQAQQHVWLAQDERRIRNKRLNTERLKRFMARRKWQVFDDKDDEEPGNAELHAESCQLSQTREITLTSDLPKPRIPSPASPSDELKIKSSADHNGNIAIPKQNGHVKTDNPVSDDSSPSFIKEMIDCEAFTGDVIRFDVRVAGSPDVEFQWLHEDEEVQEDKRHILEISGNGQCSLIIRNVTELDEGEYSCVAMNKEGRVSCSAELIICHGGTL